MILYEDTFIGRDIHNAESSYIGMDSKEKYLENLNNQSVDWYYRTTDISYVYNEFGHRSVSLESLDTTNYILFTGCSFTEGVGVELTRTYPYLVATQLGYDYYNLGLGGTGIDTLLHNLLAWIITQEHRPKAIVIQWPSSTRILSLTDSKFTTLGSWSDSKDQLEFIIQSQQHGVLHSRDILSETLIKQLNNIVPVLDVRVPLYDSKDGIPFNIIDFARDLTHPGINSHHQLSVEIIKKLS